MTARSARDRSGAVLSVVLVALLVLVGLLGPVRVARADLVPPPAPVIAGPPAGGSGAADGVWPAPPAVAAPVYLLLDVETGQVLVAERADERRPVASTVKVLTALTVLDRADLTEVVTAGDEVLGLEGASVQLRPGDQWTVEQLLLGLLIRSGNDAAEALAAHLAGGTPAFVALMADDAAALGLPVGPGGVQLYSPSGLDDENRLSAQDLATIARAALAVDTLRPILAAPETTLPRIGTDRNRNLLIGTYPGATGVKTGFTEAAGNSLVASARRGGRELIAVVLGGGPDPQRFDDAAALLDHGFDAFRPATVVAKRTLLVAGGHRTLEAGPYDVVVPVDAVATIALPLPVRVPGAATVEGAVVVGAAVSGGGDDGAAGGRPVAVVDVTVGGTAPEAVDGAAAVGRGLVDGAYAALRAAHAEGLLGTGSGAGTSR